MMGKLIQLGVLAVALLALPAIGQAQFTYTTNADSTLTITGYTGPGGAVVIPNNINGLLVTAVGNSAFYYVNGLNSITIPDSVASIGDHAFAFCSNMTNATIGSEVSNIGDWAFYSCFGLTNIVLPNSLTNIGNVAFATCYYLTNATIPDSVINIGHDAFSYCGLTSVKIPDSTTGIGDNAFYNCANLTNVTISSSLINIGTNAFGACLNLLAITVDVNNPSFSSLDGVLFNHDQTLLILFPKGKAGNYSIPGTVTGIASTFDNSSLTSITMPAGLSDISDNMFADCGGLTNVIVVGSVTNIGNSAFVGCANLAGITIPNSVITMGDDVFDSCDRLTSIKIPNHVTGIGNHEFAWCASLTNVTIGSGVVSIGDWAFWDCASLTNIVIPSSVVNIGYSAFGYTSLTNVIIPMGVTNIAGAFDICLNLTGITVDAGNPVFSSADGVLFNRNRTLLILFPKGKTGNYTIPDSVTGFGVTFGGCRLTSVAIPGGVTNIPEALFYYCTSLTNVTIADGVTGIGRIAFTGCSSLTSVTVPNSVVSFGDSVFSYCGSLRGVFFEGNALASGNDSTVFNNDTNVTIYYLPGTTGWGSTFDGQPTALWLLPSPTILNFEPNFGLKTNGFGFTISWATNTPVIVDACTNLTNPVWQPLQTNTLTTGSTYFTDSQWTNYPGRFYRLRSL